MFLVTQFLPSGPLINHNNNKKYVQIKNIKNKGKRKTKQKHMLQWQLRDHKLDSPPFKTSHLDR